VQTHDFEIREGRKSGKDGEVVLKAGTVPPPPTLRLTSRWLRELHDLLRFCKSVHEMNQG
jgi:hypothetical protein